MPSICEDSVILVETEDCLHDVISKKVAENTFIEDNSFAYSYGSEEGVFEQNNPLIDLSEIEVDVSAWIDENGKISKNIENELPKKLYDSVSVSDAEVNFTAFLKKVFKEKEKIIAVYYVR